MDDPNQDLPPTPDSTPEPEPVVQPQPVAAQPAAPAPSTQRAAITTAHGLPRRRPLLAAFFSLVPGLGNIYNGLYVRGFSIFAILWLLVSFTAAENGDPAPFTVPCIIFLMFFNILDAYRQALLINAGGTVDLGLHDLPHLEKLAGSALIPGVVLGFIGLYGAFRVYFDTNLGWLLQHWPIPMMLFGAWLTWQALRSQAKAQAPVYSQEMESV